MRCRTSGRFPQPLVQRDLHLERIDKQPSEQPSYLSQITVLSSIQILVLAEVGFLNLSERTVVSRMVAKEILDLGAERTLKSKGHSKSGMAEMTIAVVQKN